MMPTTSRRTAKRLPGPWRAAVVFLLVGGCTYNKALVEPAPPEAPSARLLRLMPPRQRDAIFPPMEQFNARSWVDRLVCENGEQPGWRRLKRDGMVEAFEVSCPGLAPFETALDTAHDEPPPKSGMRLVEATSYREFARSVALSQKKEFDGALKAIDAALSKQPDEPVYRMERVSILYGTERYAEALVEAQVLARTSNTPMSWKLAALSAQKLSLHGVVKEHVRRFAESCPPAHPLYGEAICAHGLYLLDDEPVKGLQLLKQSCDAKYKPCCEALTRRQRELSRPSESTDD